VLPRGALHCLLARDPRGGISRRRGPWSGHRPGPTFTGAHFADCRAALPPGTARTRRTRPRPVRGPISTAGPSAQTTSQLLPSGVTLGLPSVYDFCVFLRFIRIVPIALIKVYRNLAGTCDPEISYWYIHSLRGRTQLEMPSRVDACAMAALDDGPAGAVRKQCDSQDRRCAAGKPQRSPPGTIEATPWPRIKANLLSRRARSQGEN